VAHYKHDTWHKYLKKKKSKKRGADTWHLLNGVSSTLTEKT